MKQWLKSFVHNVIIHPMMMVLPKKIATLVHDLNANWAFGLERYDEMSLEEKMPTGDLTPNQVREFDKACAPLIQWLNDNKNPHTKVIVTNNSAELLDSNCYLHSTRFLKD